jgi:hypothetical protein
MWEVTQKELDPEYPPEASEEINALFGEGSDFHREHGFYKMALMRIRRAYRPTGPSDQTTGKSKLTAGKFWLSLHALKTSLFRNSPACPRRTGNSSRHIMQRVRWITI